MRRKTIWQRRAEKWHDQLDHTLGQWKLFRENAHRLLTESAAEKMRLIEETQRKDQVLVSNNVTIKELQDQVAMQHKHNSNAMQDASEAIVRHNRMVQLVTDLRDRIVLLQDQKATLKDWIKSRGLRGPYVKR